MQSFGGDFIIARIAYPYRKEFERPDFVRKLIDFLREGKTLSMITDHIMTPTFIDDIAYAIDLLISKNETGIFHVAGSQFISPYEIGILISNKLRISSEHIKKTFRKEFFKDKAPRPFHLALKNDKIRKLGVRMKTFEEGLLEII